MNKTATIRTRTQAWKNLCWLALLAVLFQTIFVTHAAAFSMQTASIYTNCNHLDNSHHNKARCLQHCASATDNYTQHYISDKSASSHVDNYKPAIVYFNTLDERTQPGYLIDQPQLFLPHLYYSADSPVYLNTSRLRI